MNPFSLEHAVRFSHCDPGGIVYFPHFFEMIYVMVEDWFDHAIEPDFESKLRQEQDGFPTVNTQCDFFKPCRVGDRLAMHASIARIGRSSVEFLLSGRVGGEERLRARHLIALVSLETLRATRCRHLIASYGQVGDCDAIDATDRYFAMLDDCVRKAFAAGTGLADIGAVCDMPAFAEWDGYATLHGANASRAFLRVEREALTR